MANKIFLAGRLTKDPEVRYTNNNLAVCSFTLAVNRAFAKEGQQQADFIPITAWGKTAEFCSKYFGKGQKVIVIGRLQVRSWDDNEGKKRWSTEVVAEEVEFAVGKKSNTGNSNTSDSYEPVQDSNTSNGFYPLEEDDELPF